MKMRLRRWLVGRPLRNEKLHEEKYNVFWGLPILASDALSSVAYASEEMLLVLVAVGMLAYGQLTYISAAIIGLVILLIFSYIQTIQNYPNGGGAYIVAKENLGVTAGVTAGAALSVDYILTVAVSISSGVAQLVSVFPSIQPYTVPICLFLILLLMVGNLRGIKESAKLFSLPAYAFIIAVVSMLIVGFFKYNAGERIAQPTLTALEPISMFILLKAFSNGCSALTGIEAVSNAVPSFKAPSIKHAKTVMILLGGLVILLFGGVSVLATLYPVLPGFEGKTVFVQIAGHIFGNSPMFYYVMGSSVLILLMAANTAYSGFPLLVSVMAKDGYAPRQLSMRGDRLSFSNGIIAISISAALLIIIFNANVSHLIGLYAIGVFISFTLSQLGMFAKWIKERGKHWQWKATINGFGGFVTAIVVVIIAFAKFQEGAWIVVFIIPLLIYLMIKVKKHYLAIARQLRIEDEEVEKINITEDHYKNRVIVPIQSVNIASVRALRYARTISENVIAFNVSIDEESKEKLEKKYSLLETDIPLIVKYSPYRKVVAPLLRFIKSAEYAYQKGEVITVVLPQFIVKKRWHSILHNQSRVFIERQLLKHKHIVIATMPLQLKDD
jgi:amino acid transporter